MLGVCVRPLAYWIWLLRWLSFRPENGSLSGRSAHFLQFLFLRPVLTRFHHVQGAPIPMSRISVIRVYLPCFFPIQGGFGVILLLPSLYSQTVVSLCRDI